MEKFARETTQRLRKRWAVRLLHRAGLYCLACERAEADTLEQAAR